jgi:hypothetical protein
MMQKAKSVIGIAEEKALTSFSYLVEVTFADADAAMTDAMGRVNAAERRVLISARTFMQDQGRAFRRQVEQFFSAYLARAMQTMHTDLRADTTNIRAEALTLIDDDVVTRQIEVDRLVLRLRDADPIRLGRINLMIAQLHGDHQVRERENPFRPYLLARALHEGLRSMVADEAKSKTLFEYLSAAMTERLPAYYAGIIDVFEARGITAKMVARPAELTRAERDRLAWKRAAEQLLDQADPGQLGTENPNHALQVRMLPKLQRLQQMQERRAQAAATPEPGGFPALDLQGLVQNVFTQGGGQRMPGHDGEAFQRGTLDEQLMHMQQSVAQGAGAAAGLQPLELRELIPDAGASPQDRLTGDLVALLFEFIVNDEKLPGALRRQLGRLQLPFMRAAMTQPEMLHEPEHPARRLLDRLGTVAAGVTPHSPGYADIEREIARIADTVLAGFDSDIAVFTDSERAFDEALVPLLRGKDGAIIRYLDAIAEAESSCALLDASLDVLYDLFKPLQVEPRLYDFLIATWVRVIAHPACSPANGALLPELIWSAQAKAAPEDRNALMKLLPALVPRVREGLALIGLPDEQSKAALDQLVAIHMDVLGNKLPPAATRLNLEELRTHFAGFGAAREAALARGGERQPAARDDIEAALAKRGLRATLVTEPKQIEPQYAHEAWLAFARPGAAFEQLVHDNYVPVRLSAVSQQDSAYVFSIPGQAAPTIYLRAALLAAMQAGTLRSLEYAPLFDRAVESLMAGAESVSGAELQN